MYKKTGIIIAALCFVFIIQSAGFAFFTKKNTIKNQPKAFAAQISDITQEYSFVPVNEADGNKIWVGTFQLVWNDLMNDIIKAPVEFVDYNSELASALNKEGFTTDDISENSYYKKYGFMTKALKKEIKNGLRTKLNEKSDILNSFEWREDNFLLYAMLKKDFEYPQKFNTLTPDDFMGKKVKFFGFEKNAPKEQLENARVLFYNSKDDYAIQLVTKQNEEVILYRTNDKKNLEEFYKDLNTKQKAYEGNKNLTKEDSLKVPFIKFDRMFCYNEFSGRQIKDSDFMITQALQTVKFNLNNKGGSLKSEAAIVLMRLAQPTEIAREFNFDKPFVLFLKEKDKNLPYFIASFQNAELFEKP